MCTTIGMKARVAGSARSSSGWVRIDEARISYDHAAHLWSEHALRLDLSSTAAPAMEPIALELDLGSARILAARLAEVVADAERVEGGGA